MAGPAKPSGVSAAPGLPRAVESDPRAEAVRVALRVAAAPLWPGAAEQAVVVSVSRALRAALEAARVAGQLARGLESVTASLGAEARGLQAAGMDGVVRISRLVLVSDDGSERFYRQVAGLLRTHGRRVLVLRVRCDAATLGALIDRRGSPAKAIAVTHKAAVAAVLLALAESDPARSA